MKTITFQRMDTTSWFVIAHKDENNAATIERKLKLTGIYGDMEIVVVNTDRRSKILPTIKAFKKRVDSGEVDVSVEGKTYLAKLCRMAELGNEIFTTPSGEMTKVIEASLAEDWRINRENVMYF